MFKVLFVVYWCDQKVPVMSCFFFYFISDFHSTSFYTVMSQFQQFSSSPPPCLLRGKFSYQIKTFGICVVGLLWIFLHLRAKRWFGNTLPSVCCITNQLTHWLQLGVWLHLGVRTFPVENWVDVLKSKMATTIWSMVGKVAIGPFLCSCTQLNSDPLEYFTPKPWIFSCVCCSIPVQKKHHIENYKHSLVTTFSNRAHQLC